MSDSLASSVCEVNAGITPSNKAITMVAVQKIIFPFSFSLDSFNLKNK